jgi:hypothetical protein
MATNRRKHPYFRNNEIGLLGMVEATIEVIAFPSVL